MDFSITLVPSWFTETAQPISGLPKPETKLENLEPQPTSPKANPVAQPSASCNLCSLKFNSFVEQREHFKSPQHLHAVKNKQPNTGAQKVIKQDDKPAVDKTEVVQKHASSCIWYSSTKYPEYKFGMYKAIFPDDIVDPLTWFSAEPKRTWTLIQYSGGYFAAMVVCPYSQTILCHKAIHAYTQRKKQGKSQLKQDMKKKTKSGGAQIRRENQKHLDLVSFTVNNYIENQRLAREVEAFAGRKRKDICQAGAFSQSGV